MPQEQDYGFIAPSNKQEYIALLDEALSMADDLSSQISEMDGFLKCHEVLTSAAH